MRLSSALTAVAVALLALPVLAAKPQSNPVYQADVHYFPLPEPVPVADPSKIEVTEVFWYGCGHCFRFEPLVQEWKQEMPDDVYFEQLPAMWSLPMEAHARAYYTARELGLLSEAHQAIYDALNLERKSLTTAEEVAAFLAQFGADQKEAAKIFGSPEATVFLKEADAKARAYQITGTPQLVVDGRYRVQVSQSVPQDQVFAVVEFLLDKVRAEKRSKNDS